jgi:signal transduction histidine kinase
LFAYAGGQVRLRQTVFNLLNDALSNISDDENVTLTLGRRGTCLRITAAHSLRRPQAETGIALALVRRFVRLEGGRVDVEMLADGQRMVCVEVPLPKQQNQTDLPEVDIAVSPLAVTARSR